MTRRFYVPEIGDIIELTNDWTFTLYKESRNDTLWKLLDCDNAPENENKRKERDLVKQKIADIDARTPKKLHRWHSQYQSYDYSPADAAKRQKLADRIHYGGDLYIDKALITLPKGTELTIDRVYIRKGVSEYSSLTFNILECPLKELTPIKQGGIMPKGYRRRFWAKLADVNNIEFEAVVQQK